MIRMLQRLRRDNSGAVLIEFAFVAPILALMSVGAIDMSNAFGKKLQLEQAAQRSIEKVMQTTGELTVEQTIATEAVCQYNGTNENGTCKTAPITTANVTVTHRLECNGTVTADADCPDGETESRWIQVVVRDNYQPMFALHFAGLNDDGTYHLQATAGMRTE
ncbi:TadE/TadG family type IV pilus assembly protein [Sphingomonas sp.]|uniref:TadE/TadG family type IV pilus assembly protein n=1 Tax=Sphingomonas sp. TaxID=28214 RepID=UPI0025E550EB|nr:TadE/TadG family type IV pilus assembly protein [Sphingomonas sp.]